MNKTIVCQFAAVAKRSSGLLAGSESLISSGSTVFSFSTITGPAARTFRYHQNAQTLARYISTQKLTNSITFVSNEKKKFKSWKKGTKCEESAKFALEASPSATPTSKNALIQTQIQTDEDGNKLCVLIGWLMSEQKHIMKYGKFYLDQGFDLLIVRCSPWQLLWPVTGGKVISKDMLTFMENNPQYKTMFLHAFSVGAYVWGQLLVHHRHDPIRYQFLHDRLVGQIWDSIVDIEGVQQGIGGALFPNNWLVRNAIEGYVRFHVNTFQESVMKHYLETRSAYHNSVLRSPVLIYSSESDPVALYSIVELIADKWEKLGIEVYQKTWKNSPHVSHMWRHPEEYKTEMKAFLDKLGLLRYPDKFQVKNPVAVARHN